MSSDATTLRLGALFYEAFELLDIYGPLEMFGSLGEKVEIVTVAEQAGPVASFQGPKTLADHGFDDCPKLDLLILPGGIGTVRELANEKMLDFLRKRSAEARVTMSVCTGSALLARAGVLDGLRATSNKQFFDLAVQQSERVEWVSAARWVDAGRFVTASGVSAGMDMALAVIERLFSTEDAERIAVLTEYTWHRDAEVDPFVKHLNELIPDADSH
jgi:putative intracellular protease/amidase